jgi:hypothetical protein
MKGSGGTLNNGVIRGEEIQGTLSENPTKTHSFE